MGQREIKLDKKKNLPMISHKQYKQLITPINRTRYRSATPPATNQKRTITPLIPKINTQVLWTESALDKYLVKRTYNQSLLAHHRVNKKNTASTILAILLAFVSNPHAMRAAPMKEEPR